MWVASNYTHVRVSEYVCLLYVIIYNPNILTVHIKMWDRLPGGICAIDRVIEYSYSELYRFYIHTYSRNKKPYRSSSYTPTKD